MKLDFKTRAGRVGYLKLKGFAVNTNGTWRKDNKEVPGYVLEYWIWPKAFKIIVDNIDSRKEQFKDLHKAINKINNDVIDDANNNKKHKKRGTFFEINYDTRNISRNTRAASEVPEENLQDNSSSETTSHETGKLKKDITIEHLSIERRDILANKKEKNDIIEFSDLGNLFPTKQLRAITLTNRNITLSKNLKELYDNKCQICSEKLECGWEQYLIEVHHIKPLGGHCGADVAENMIVLCPNHHLMFDRGAISIDITNRKVIHFNPQNPLNNRIIELNHDIDNEYIDYHNQNIFNKSTSGDNEETSLQEDLSGSMDIAYYGDTITLLDVDSNEAFVVKLEDKYNKDFMKPIEKLLVNKSVNEVFTYDKFKYKVLSIMKIG